MITKFKLFENHFDLDPYGEEDWDDNNTFLKWLMNNYQDRYTWNDIERIDFSHYNITSLEGLENLPNLQILNCSYNNLTSLEGIEKLKLKQLWCNNNELTSLDGIENLTNLKELDCYGNQLTSLEGIEKLKLKQLWCDRNQFSDEYKQYLKDYCKKNNIGLHI